MGLFVLYNDVLSRVGYKVNWRKLNEKNHATFLKDRVLKADALCDATLTPKSTAFLFSRITFSLLVKTASTAFTKTHICFISYFS